MNSFNAVRQTFEADNQDQYDIDLDSMKVDDDHLALEAIGNVHKKFVDWGHAPSSQHWRGLRHIAKVYQYMAAGVAAPVFYLSSLPCGMGKTTVATECTKALIAGDAYKSVGVIYFLSRLEEINALVDAMGLEKSDFSVLVSESRQGDVNDLGNPVASKARVLFTTQQQLEARLKDGSTFTDIAAFHYLGRPRLVRVWDEAIVPSKILTLDQDDISSMFRDLRQNSLGSLRDLLEDWSIALRNMETGQTVEVPDIEPYVSSLDAFRGVFDNQQDQDKAEALWYLSGRTVRIRRSQDSAATTFDYEDNLPEDLAPMLILDASGGLRETYSFWRRDRGGLKSLPSPTKTYSGLTLHHWDRGAGKTVYRDRNKALEIAKGVAKAINTEIPLGEEVLVIHHRQVKKRDPDMVKLIRGSINPEAKVYFCNWGKHTATNQYAHIRHVILAGILQYNEAQYEAHGRAAKKAKTEEEFDDNDFQKTRFGEIAHNIFQAACRGEARKTVNGDCPEGCHLYLIFSTDKKRGFPRDGLSRIFPQAPIIDWLPVWDLKGNNLKVVEAIKSAYLVDQPTRISNDRLIELTGITNRANLNKSLKDPVVNAALAEHRITLSSAWGAVIAHGA
ncbi:hypothetical protein QFZ34_002203 [Phyllobacterium ifriqiyense]|uniref:Helicase/UvrB N-terminal domain-containing protein n=1 Tax=Phyllobacterium ifriqiyense TaxID=314238 RepID=A0ABU0S8E7_9HYPH|nr:hypothetical protein [Phyllobacterium ifriqiyense]MDQ0997021.1 hypothetical protein [Phyllobacterium ifriqiyense]